MSQLCFTQFGNFNNRFVLTASIAREIFSPCKLMTPSKTSVADRKISKMKGKRKESQTVLGNVSDFTVKLILFNS